MKSQILIETINNDTGNIIVESLDDSAKTMYLSGTFMQSGIKNRNGRTYPLSEMTSAVADANLAINNYGGIFGELDHPENKINITMRNVSHTITELYMDGNNAVGKIKLLNTPMGLIARELGNSGVKYGVSSRALGTLDEHNIVSGMKFITLDLVRTPSAPNSYPTTILESLENYHNGRILSLAESLKHDMQAQKYFKNEILKFVNSLLT